jgi:hypothetical protein
VSVYPVYLFERRHEGEIGNPNLVLAGKITTELREECGAAAP